MAALGTLAAGEYLDRQEERDDELKAAQLQVEESNIVPEADLQKVEILSIIMTATWPKWLREITKVAVRSVSRSGMPATACPLAKVAARNHKSGCENHEVAERITATFPLSEA